MLLLLTMHVNPRCDGATFSEYSMPYVHAIMLSLMRPPWLSPPGYIARHALEKSQVRSPFRKSK